MVERTNVWPADPDYSNQNLWEKGVEIAYCQNDLRDTICQHKQWLQNTLEMPEDDDLSYRKKMERIDNLQNKLRFLIENDRTLSHAVGVLIGREGLVTQSPHKNQAQQLQDQKKPGHYFLDGEVVPLEL